MASSQDKSLKIQLGVETNDAKSNLRVFYDDFKAKLKEMGATDQEIGYFARLVKDVQSGKIAIGELSAETQGLIRSFQQNRDLAAARDFLGIPEHAKVREEIQKTRQAYELLAQSGKLTGAELAQASLKADERVRALEASTNGWAQSLGKMKGELAASAAGIYGVATQLSAAASASSEFSKQMAEVSTLLDDTSGMAGMTQAVEDLALQYGGDVGDKARALYDTISAGADTSEEAIANLTAANKLAVGGVTEVGVAADGLTSAMNAYGDAAGSADNVSDAFFTAVRAGKTTVAELSGSLGNVAPVANAAGVGLDELLSAVASLTASGLKTPEAMTALKGALTSVIKPSKEASDLAAELGLKFDATALKSQGLAGFLQSVQAATGGNIETMGKLFGSVEGLNGVLTLTGSGADKFADTLAAMATKAGATDEAVAKMMETPAARAARFEASMAGIQRSLGDAVTAFSPLLDAVTSLMNEFNGLDSGTKAIIAGLAGVGAAALPVSFAVKSMGDAYGILKNAIIIATSSMGAGTAAAKTGATAMTTHGVEVGRAAGAYTLLQNSMRLVGWGLVIEKAVELTGAIRELYKIKKETADINDRQAKQNRQLAEDLARVTKETGIQVGSIEDLDAAIAAQTVHFDAAANSWKAGPPVLKAIGDAAGQAKPSLEELAKQEFGTATREAGALAAQLEVAAGKGKDAGKAVAEVVDGVDLLDPANAVAVARAVDWIAEAGGKGAAIVEGELNAALAKLSATDLAKLSTNLRDAFAAGKISAEELNTFNDQVLAEGFKRLGINAADALGKISPAAADAIGSLDAIAASLDRAGIDGIQRMTALGEAITAALSRADSLAAVESLREKITAMGAAGKLSGEQLTAALEAARRKADELTPGINGVEEAYKRLGITSQAELQKEAAALQAALEVLRTKGAALEDQRAGWAKYAQAAIAANGGIADSSIQAEAAMYGYEIATDRAGKATIKAMTDAADATDQAGRAARAAAGGYREMADEAGNAYAAAEKLRRAQAEANRQAGGSQTWEQILGQGFDLLSSDQQDAFIYQYQTELLPRILAVAQDGRSINTNASAGILRDVRAQIDAIARARVAGIDAGTAPPQSTTSRVVIQLPSGRAGEINVASAKDAQTLTDLLKQLQFDLGRT